MSTVDTDLCRRKFSAKEHYKENKMDDKVKAMDLRMVRYWCERCQEGFLHEPAPS